MKIILKWQLNKDNLPINACAIDPVHDQMIIAVGKSIIVLDVINGNEIRKCEKHTQDVTCLAYRKDGLWFASGGKDNLVYLWDVTNLSRPMNKITFIDPLLQICYNPCVLSLIAISRTGLALYRETANKGGTNKYNLSNTAVCISWTSDGLRFAIGFENGSVSIREKDNEKELKTITLNDYNQERVWSISFSSTRFRNKDYVLFVGTWEKNLYIIELFNYTIIDCKKLNYDPICFGLFKDDYFLIGSNNNEVNLFTKEGIHINSICEGVTDWVMSIKASNKYNSFVVCTNDGKVLNYQINFQIVHGIHYEKYVYRNNLMDLIIHNLITGFKSKIKCKKFIKKLAVYKDLIACLNYDKVCIYQLNEEGTSKVPKYYVKCEGDFNLILLASSHLFVCLDNRLISYELTSNINSVPSREWTFESDIKYLKVLGGATKREALIAGLKNGEIYMIYVDNQFPILLFQHDIPIRSLDVNCTRKKLGIVDENHNLLVIDISTKNVILKDEKAKSIAFNSEIEDMLSYWYEGNVYIKTSDFHPISEKMNGIIVGFRGTKVFLLQAMNTINVLDISHSATIMRYTEKKEFEESYKVACLGATNQELLYIGFEALLNFNFIVAVNCFKKLQDIRLINLVLKVEQDRKDKSYGDEILKADIMCNTGEYEKAADLYIKAGHPEKAIEMYALLKKWAEAMEIKKKFPGKDIDITDGLLSQQADWLYENGKYTEAADLYLLLARKRKAIEIYGEKGMLDKLIEICRVLNKDDSPDLIGLCGYYFRKHRHYQYATEAYLKLGDTKSLVLMNVELERWDKAFLLAQQNKKLLEHCYLQYAESLILKDKFKEAQQSFKKAGRTDLSMKLLEKLIDNAVYEKRHKDACSFFIQYSHDALSSITEYNSNSNKIEILKVKDYIDSFELADIFNAYDIVYKYIEEPFSSDLLAIDDYGLFNTCKYLVNKITNFKTIKKQINGINPAYIYYALAFLSKQFEAFKTARFSFEKLNTLQFPVTWQSKIDYEIMTIRSKPYLDKDSNMPVCYRCLNTNPLVNIKGDRCTVCLAPFIRSPITQEILPLIEFKPKKEISYDLALEIIKSSEIARIQKPLIQSKNDTGYNMMLINQDDSPHEDLFGIRLVEWCENKLSNEEYRIYEVDENVLKSLNESEVFIIDLRHTCNSKPTRFFKNRMKDIFITLCNSCHRFFRTEEYENMYLKNNSCPVCNNPE